MSGRGVVAMVFAARENVRTDKDKGERERGNAIMPVRLKGALMLM